MNCCAKSRTRPARPRSIALLVALTLLLAGLTPTVSRADLPAPAWLPGFPILAGPQVIMMWLPVPGAVKYKVYLNGKQAAESAANQLTLPAPTEGGEYKVEVGAVDGQGKEGKKSTVASFKVILISPPKGLTTLAAGNALQLRWEPSLGAVIYNVYRKAPGEKEFKMLASTQDSRATDSGVKEGQDYAYQVTSKDISGKESAPSQQAVGRIEKAVVKTRKEFTLNPLAVTKVGSMEFENYTYDVAIREGAAIVGIGKLAYVSDVASGARRILLREKTGFGGVAFSAGGKVYTGHSGDQSVYVINPEENEIVATYKVPNPAPGELVIQVDGKPRELNGKTSPYDVALDSTGNIYVTDNENNRVVKLSPDGKYLGTVGKKGAGEDWRISKPTYIHIDKNDRKYVTSISSITIFDKDDQKIATFGQTGGEVGTFGNPRAVAVDPKGYLFVADSRNNNVQLFQFNPEEKTWEPAFVLSNETKDGNPSWIMPTGIDLSVDGGTLYMTESFAKMFSVWRINWK